MNVTMTGEQLQAVTALLFAVNRVRWVLQRGCRFHDKQDMMRHVLSLVEHPWLTCAHPTQTRQDRRAARVRPPAPSEADFVYRSDGAARGQGRTHAEIASSFGAVRLSGNAVDGSIAQSLNPCSNNVAEYRGLIACLQDALCRRARRVDFQVDSMIVAKQSTMEWACRSAELRPLCAEVWRLLRALQEGGSLCTVGHIFREFNSLADALANEAINTGRGQVNSWHMPP